MCEYQVASGTDHVRARQVPKESRDNDVVPGMAQLLASWVWICNGVLKQQGKRQGSHLVKKLHED